MSEDKLFNSKTKPVPQVRRDIDIIPVQNNGDSYLYFHDIFGYATPNFALDSQVSAVLSLLDGSNSIEDMKPYLGTGVDTDRLLDYVRFLDQNRLLRSDYLKKYSEQVEQEYEAAAVHRSVTAGVSYPADPKELVSFLDEAFANIATPEYETGSSPRALYAPHIDPRVGVEAYVKAFAPIRKLQPKRVVILATSHYGGYYSADYDNESFIVSRKDFEMPLGRIPSDKEAIDRLLENASGTGLTDKDRAHRIEHSIELHLLFLSYLWDHHYTIVPILVDGLEDLFYMKDGHREQQLGRMGKLIQKHFGDDDETFFLISGDLAHFGKKFGDSRPAKEMFEEVKRFDEQFLEHAHKASDQDLLKLVKKDYDPYRICGFPPLYTFLRSMPGLKGEVLGYDLWDEEQRESAVTFASILYS